MVKVWISKYALRDGIKELEIDSIPKCGAIFVHVDPTNDHDIREIKRGKDWHETYESAAERAETLRKRKIESLRKQIERLEALHF